MKYTYMKCLLCPVPESPIAPAPPQIVQPLIDIEPKDTKPSKPNGDVKPLRRESKGFR